MQGSCNNGSDIQSTQNKEHPKHSYLVGYAVVTTTILFDQRISCTDPEEGFGGQIPRRWSLVNFSARPLDYIC